MSVSVNDISDLMQKCVKSGYTFMFSPSGLQGNYNIYVAYMPKLCDNRSLRLTLKESEEIIYRCADENDGYSEFDSVDSALLYIDRKLTGDDDD